MLCVFEKRKNEEDLLARCVFLITLVLWGCVENEKPQPIIRVVSPPLEKLFEQESLTLRPGERKEREINGYIIRYARERCVDGCDSTLTYGTLEQCVDWVPGAKNKVGVCYCVGEQFYALKQGRRK